MAKQDLTQARLKELLRYDPDTGVFTWAVKRPASRARVGDVAGHKSARGYLVISLCSTQEYAHRLAWLYVHGAFPSKGLDHIDGDKLNNRIANLREATQAQNLQNIGSRRNSTGYTGVRIRSDRSAGKLFAAQIMVNRKNINLGYFDTPEEAHEAYLKGKAELHTFQPTLR